MDIEAYREEIKLKALGAGILMSELPDSTLDMIINSALRELQRYINTTTIMTVPYQKCIDLSDKHINSVIKVFRATGLATTSDNVSNTMDPMYATQWQLLSGMGNLNNFQNGLYNFLSYNTLMQIRNTTSTDLAFYFDPIAQKLYVNFSEGQPSQITIMYVPRFTDVSQITSDYWIDKLCLLSVALTKTIVGRIRSKFTLTNSQYSLDGAALLQEGNAELQQLRTELVQYSDLLYAID